MSNLNDMDFAVADFMADFGVVGNLVVQDDSTAVYDPNVGALTGATIVKYPCNMIFLDYTLQRYGLQDQQGTLIEAGDKQLMLQPINKADPTKTMPKIHPNKDRIESPDGSVYKIASLKQVNPTMQNNILYELHLKE